jgi:hypothetical protein
MGNRHTQQVTEAGVMQTGIILQKENAGDKTWVIRENILLEIHNTKPIIRCCSPQLRSAVTIITKTATVFRKQYASRQHVSCLHYGAADYDSSQALRQKKKRLPS